MTVTALRQFTAICGGPTLCKGARYEEPLRGPEPPVAVIMGQCDYIAVARSSLTQRMPNGGLAESGTNARLSASSLSL